MKTNKAKSVLANIDSLTNTISQTNTFFLNKVQKQVNSAMTLRNWIIGYYIVEYEQSGKDRFDYGKQLFKAIADRLIKKGVKSIRERQMYLCKDLYNAYPQILRTVSAKSYLENFRYTEILLTLSAELSQPGKSKDSMKMLLTHLSFTHFIELLKLIQTINAVFMRYKPLIITGGIRDSKRAIESLLYERTSLTSVKEIPIQKCNKQI